MNAVVLMSLVDIVLGMIDRGYALLRELDAASEGLGTDERAQYKRRRDSALQRARDQVAAQE